jgi:hypothetical protein
MIRRAIPIVCFGACAAAWAATIWRGDWREFGLWLLQIPAIFKQPGPRTAFLLRWLAPLIAAYGLVLSLSIFWGLRRESLRR